MLDNLNLSGRLKTAIGIQSGSFIKNSEDVKAVNQYINAIPTNEDDNNEQMIKKPMKTIKVKDLLRNGKMKKPIDKLSSMKSIVNKEGETTEATSAGSAGGYEAPLFSKPKRMDSMFKDEQPKKKVKGGFVYENKKKQSSEEKLKGGKSDKMSLEDIAKKHDKKGYYHIDNMVSSLKKQLNKGIKVEMEHTKDKKIAKEIVMDHLFEDPNYYDKLKKVEATEATDSSSSGSYVTPAAWAKSTNKKDWRGASKTQIPGGKFVQVKKKCKTFPYCNQGDIKALNIFENKTLQKVITKISKEHNISESVIKNILAYEYEKNTNSK
jgi:hypothetical protein